jgi:hypothetical protein
MSVLWRRAVIAALSIPMLVFASHAAFAKPRPGDGRNGRTATLRDLQRVLDEVRTRLGIDREVTLALVAKNPFVVSVEAPARKDAPYVVRLEEGLLELLTPEEMEAALAHELGHVWVFTHHPYLQTERLANQVALRAVSRDALARVYQKVWQAGGTKGDLVRFLGAPGATDAPGPRPQQE